MGQNLTKTEVIVWGAPEYGQLGISPIPPTPITPPTIIDTLRNSQIVQVSTRYHHSAAVSVHGEVFTWGRGGEGQLGHGERNDTIIPRRVKSLVGKKVRMVSCGAHHTAACTEEGVVYTWGRSSNGRLGLSSSTLSQQAEEGLIRSPVCVETLSEQEILGVACGSFLTFFWDFRCVWSCGLGVSGRLGHGNEVDCQLPTLVKLLEGKNIVSLSCGTHHSACVTKDGELYTWGGGSFGKLGHGNYSDQLTPKLVSPDLFSSKKVMHVALGAQHSACISTVGDLYTWGQAGRLGHEQSTEIDELVPRKVMAFSGRSVMDVSCGLSHTVAILKSGETFVWGTSRALSHKNSAVPSNSPSSIDLLSNGGVSVSAGETHTLILVGVDLRKTPPLKKENIPQTDSPHTHTKAPENSPNFSFKSSTNYPPPGFIGVAHQSDAYPKDSAYRGFSELTSTLKSSSLKAASPTLGKKSKESKAALSITSSSVRSNDGELSCYSRSKSHQTGDLVLERSSSTLSYEGHRSKERRSRRHENNGKEITEKTPLQHRLLSSKEQASLCVARDLPIACKQDYDGVCLSSKEDIDEQKELWKTKNPSMALFLEDSFASYHQTAENQLPRGGKQDGVDLSVEARRAASYGVCRRRSTGGKRKGGRKSDALELSEARNREKGKIEAEKMMSDEGRLGYSRGSEDEKRVRASGEDEETSFSSSSSMMGEKISSQEIPYENNFFVLSREFLNELGMGGEKDGYEDERSFLHNAGKVEKGEDGLVHKALIDDFSSFNGCFSANLKVLEMIRLLLDKVKNLKKTNEFLVSSLKRSLEELRLVEEQKKHLEEVISVYTGKDQDTERGNDFEDGCIAGVKAYTREI